MVSPKRMVKSIAVIGNHLPRQCGIATFTTDLCAALAAEMPRPENVIALAMDDVPGGYDYPDRVKFEIRDKVQLDYLQAADFINVNKPDIAIIQHEFGIFGGPSGAYVFHLLENLRMPVMTTLHTVLAEPDDEKCSVIARIADISERLIIMAHKAKELLLDVYNIPETKISLIPHGIPDVPFIDSSYYKDQFNVENRKVILSFGLLSPGKGIEHMIDAMPDIVAQHPDAVYIILGTTHPHIIRQSGEKYRHGLQQRARQLGVETHVLFRNEFMDLSVLTKFLTIADIYVTPYLSPDQIVSGTLSYALGMGKAVISTPYWYAQELLAEERGILVPFENPGALSESVNALLASDARRNSMRKRAYQYTRPMVWKEVARNHLDLAQQILEERIHRPHYSHLELKPQKLETLPEINLQHLHIMTDDTGILQHALYSIPNRDDGYCLDDNARALIVASRYYELRHDESIIPMLKKYLAFTLNAFNSEKGRFRNFMSYDRRWLEEAGSQDAHGRALWGLGVAIQTAPDQAIRDLCCQLFVNGIGYVQNFSSLRACSFALVGIHHYLNVYVGEADVRRIRVSVIDKLYRRFQENGRDDWPWPEDILTYANGIMPHALILTGQALSDEHMLTTGLESLRWLLNQQTHDAGHISLIGNEGWMQRNGERASFDQQPVEAMGLVEACAEAFRATNDDFWLQEARRCFEWFLGKNDLNLPVSDFKSGGCHDGLHPNGVSENMGAESTLAWLMARIDMDNLFGQEVLKKINENNGEMAPSEAGKP